ncbi:MAG: hypothetical protein ACYDBP_09735 [Leptospirales bacterium]
MVNTNAESFPHFRMVLIFCPIGHYIGLMVYNYDAPILLDTGQRMTLYGEHIKIRVIKLHEKAGKVLFALNGRPIREPAESTV